MMNLHYCRKIIVFLLENLELSDNVLLFFLSIKKYRGSVPHTYSFSNFPDFIPLVTDLFSVFPEFYREFYKIFLSYLPSLKTKKLFFAHLHFATSFFLHSFTSFLHFFTSTEILKMKLSSYIVSIFLPAFTISLTLVWCSKFISVTYY